MRILLVEDDLDLARGLQLALSQQGFAVNQVSLGQQALASIRSQDCDAVVLDLGLPDMDGLEVLKITPAEVSATAGAAVNRAGWGG